MYIHSYARHPVGGTDTEQESEWINNSYQHRCFSAGFFIWVSLIALRCVFFPHTGNNYALALFMYLYLCHLFHVFQFWLLFRSLTSPASNSNLESTYTYKTNYLNTVTLSYIHWNRYWNILSSIDIVKMITGGTQSFSKWSVCVNVKIWIREKQTLRLDQHLTNKQIIRASCTVFFCSHECIRYYILVLWDKK